MINVVGDAKRDPSLPQVISIQGVDLIHRDAQVHRLFESVTERRWGLTFY
jgi:hypothetical protein